MGTMKFRIGIAATVTIAVLLGTSGCSAGGAGEAGSSVTLKLVATTDADQDAIDEVIDAFHRANSDISVEASYSQSDVFLTNTPRSLETPNGPDVVMTFPGVSGGATAYALQDAGLIVDQSKADWVDQIPEASRVMLGHDGFVAFKPVGVDTIGVVYNEQLFADAGVEPATTWSDMLALCGTLRDEGIQPMSFGLQSSFVTLFVSFALAASTVYADTPDFDAQQLEGEATFSDTPGWAEAFEKFVAMRDAGCFADGYEGTTYDGMIQQIGAKQVAMTVTPAPSLAAIRAADPDDSFAMFPLPAYDDASRNGVPQNLSVGAAINAKSKHLDAAQKFVDFLNNDENSLALAKAYSVIPLSADAPAPEGMEQMIAAFANGRIGTFSNQLWIAPETLNAYTAGAQQLFSDQLSVSDFLKSVDGTVTTR